LRSFAPPACGRQAQDDREKQLRERDGDEGEAFFAPGGEAALERADALDAVFSEEQRHTGAGGFVRSSTVENDFAIARQAVVLFLQFAGIHAKSARNRFRVGFKVHRMAQIHNDKILTGVDFFF
jgi:hypothetical protein